jgi:probable HAF family extracellular repeat protein
LLQRGRKRKVSRKELAMKTLRLAAMFAGMVAAVLAALPVRAAPAYAAVPLGTLGGTSGAGANSGAINASGRISGLAYLPGNTVWHAVIYANGTVQDLGALGGTLSNGTAINDSGQVTGFALVGSESRAFMYANGVMTDIGSLGGKDSAGTGINASGQIAGASSLAGNTVEHAFRYGNGVMTDLGTLGGANSIGQGINASGQVTGFSDLPLVPALGSRQHAFLHSGGIMHDLGTLGGGFSDGFAVNDRGQVTGHAAVAVNEVTHAFIYSAGAMQDLGTLGGSRSIGLSINASGQVVGSAEMADGAMHAFVYADGAMHDLNQLVSGLAGTVLNLASGINDSGQIAASACSASFICQAFRLDPLPQAPPPVVKVAAVEFHHAEFDHYFITADPGEIAALNGGMFQGWAPTGEAINVYTGSDVESASVCRFFGASFGPKSSHFYTHDAGECMVVKQSGEWNFEGFVMNIPVPDATGNCAATMRPVYRLYNGGQGGAPSHRYTTSLAIVAQMRAQGWISEGYGDDGVFMCSPA